MSPTYHSKDQGSLELEKLRVEIEKLKSEVGWLGRFSRLAWPIVSSLLTAFVAALAVFITYGIQKQQTSLQRQQTDLQKQQGNLREYEVFLEALKNAAAETQGEADVRIAGLWAVGSHWNQYPEIVANTLAAVLVTGPDLPREPAKQGAHDLVRLVADYAIAQGIDPLNAANSQKHARLLFGDCEGGRPGSITLVQWHLLQVRGGLAKTRLRKREGDVIELLGKLYVTKDVIQKWKNHLRQAHFGECDLSEIDLSNGDLSRACFDNANLYRTDLQQANFEKANLDRADLQCTNLVEARMKGVKNYQNVKSWDHANVYRIAAEDVRRWALNHGAVDMDPKQWKDSINTVCPTNR